MKQVLAAVLTLSISLLAAWATAGTNDPSAFSEAKGAYLGQTPPGAMPEVFAPGVVSTKAGWEAAISFSPDLSELFFSNRASIEGTENRIMHMKKINNVWTEAKPASFARDTIEYEAFITPDYKKVIFKSQRPNPAGTTREGGIWYSPRENGAWSEARYIPGPINTGWIMSVTSTLDNTLYFTGSFKDGYGIYRSRFTAGQYGQSEFLPVEVNKSKYFGASHPYIAPDESYLIFDAPLKGNSELFISFKKEDGGWTEARAFDQPINSEGYEGIATVSPDGNIFLGWEAAISFSPDLSELFFSYRASIEGTENRIMHMKKINNVWTEAKPASFARDTIEYEAFITPDYKKVIFKSQRPNPAGTTREGGIWYSPRENGAWSEARYIPGPINTGWIMSVTSTLDNTLYFTGSFKDGYGIYRSRFINGEYAPPEFLPAAVNKSKYFGASHPYIAPDESYLIFDAPLKGNSELFISFKKEDGGWTEARAFDQPINSEGYEAIATVSPDGKYLFFNRGNDIYWVSAEIIGEIKGALK